MRRLPLWEFGLGAAAGMGLEPFGFAPAPVIAFALLLARLAATPGARRAFLQALAFGAGYYTLALHWIVEPFFVVPEETAWMAPFALVLMALGGGLFWALPVAAAHRWTSGQRRIPGLAAALLLAEWLRGWIFTGFPWGTPGQAWLDTPVAQLAADIGQLGLTALTLALAALLAATWRGPRALLLLPAGLLAVAVAGGLMLARAPLGSPPGVTIRLVQPNAAQALKWEPAWAAEFWRRLLALSSGPTAAGSAPDLVVWPETAVSFLLNDAAGVLPVMAEAAGGAPLLLGIQRSEGRRWWNSAVEVTPEGTIGALYDKAHLVPFGEYIPQAWLLERLGLGAFAAQNGFGYSAGPGMTTMRLPGLPPFQPLICYEAVFPGLLRGQPDAAFTLQITNDAWFGTFAGPRQHLAQARLRAIESGRPLLRAANTGISAAIDARGRVLAALPMGAEGRLDVALPGRRAPTPWDRLGDAPLLALLALLVAALGIAEHSRKSVDPRGRRL